MAVKFYIVSTKLFIALHCSLFNNKYPNVKWGLDWFVMNYDVEDCEVSVILLEITYEERAQKLKRSGENIWKLFLLDTKKIT